MSANPYVSSKILYLVWDADGTLFDSYPAIVQALLDAMKTFGVEPDFAWLNMQARQSLGITYTMLAQRYHLDEQYILTQYRQAWLQIPLETQPVFPFVKDVCRYILDKGGQNFILTHRRRISLERLTQFYAMQAYFTASVTKDDGYPDKPDPQGLKSIITQYGLPPSQVMMIGDREIDVQAGKNASVYSCLYGTNTLQEPADYHFTNYADMLDLLKTQA
jgi:phosphoglycolate phosphatase-like HAD superfamily hydrolase